MNERWHGFVLVATAACIPLGEGIAFVALALLACCLLRRRHAVRWDIVRLGVTGRLLGAFCVFLSAGLLAVVAGREGWLKPAEMGRWVPFLLVPLVILSMTVLPRIYLSRAAAAFLLTLGMAAFFGLCQYGFDLHFGRATDQALVPGTDHAVAGGFYFHRLKMAHVLLVGLAALMARQFFMALTWRRRLAEAGLIGLFLTTLLFTFTRGAFLGLAALSLGCVAWASWRWRLTCVVVALLAIIALGAVPTVRQRLHSIGGGEAVAVRALIWSQAVRVLADHPLGVGLGNYTPLIGRYYDRIDAPSAPRTYPHNILLAAWAEAGPVGVVAYVWMWFTFANACVQRLRLRVTDPDDAGARAVAAAGLGGCLAFWTVGMTHDVLFHNAVALAFCGLMAFTLGFLFTRPSRRIVSPRASER